MFIRVWTGSGMSSQVTQFQNPKFVKWNTDISNKCSNIITNFTMYDITELISVHNESVKTAYMLEQTLEILATIVQNNICLEGK
jgi:hypothetical protein